LCIGWIVIFRVFNKMEEKEQLSKKRKRPVKPFHNVRAHANPLSDNVFEGTPVKPDDFDWTVFYPEFIKEHQDQNPNSARPQVEIADIGCGFGGLLCKKQTPICF
jgi:2-polyprenyl-3-methyl-5-hydroxy-6-metoxy-1,4-benzoquinol methylase